MPGTLGRNSLNGDIYELIEDYAKVTRKIGLLQRYSVMILSGPHYRDKTKHNLEI